MLPEDAGSSGDAGWRVGAAEHGWRRLRIPTRARKIRGFTRWRPLARQHGTRRRLGVDRERRRGTLSLPPESGCPSPEPQGRDERGGQRTPVKAAGAARQGGAGEIGVRGGAIHDNGGCAGRMTEAVDCDTRVRESFARQAAMRTIGATVAHVAPGEVDLRMPYRAELGQQHGSIHAGMITALADSAGGYAALTLMPPGADVVSVEFKVNLLAPAFGDSFVARARVKRAGRTLTVVTVDVFAERAGAGEKIVATLQGTMMAVAAPQPPLVPETPPRPEHRGPGG